MKLYANLHHTRHFFIGVEGLGAVAAYTVLLYGTLTVAFDLYTAVYGRLGEVEMSQSINRVFLVAGLALLGFIVLGLPRKVRSYLVFGLICLAVAVCLQVIRSSPVPPSASTCSSTGP